MVRAQTNDEGETIGDVEWTKKIYVDADGFVNLCEKAHVASVLCSPVTNTKITSCRWPKRDRGNDNLDWIALCDQIP